MFKLLGALLALYIAQCLATGAVFAKSGLWGRTYRRDDDAFHYWCAIVVYAGLALALFFWF